MPKIALLSQDTIDKIAAGEVIERPASVVKELVENAMDAGATAVTVEIKDGGISFIRITDNGCGIEKEQVPLAFLRHSTSKIRSVEDLLSIHSLGFRGEALSSISAISRVELFTKTRDDFTGTRYVIEGSKEISFEETGAPDGTTFLVKDLFYNTPARRKFLKAPQTEGNYISDMLEKLALSHPEVSLKYIQNNNTKLHSSGNGNIKDVIYHIYGRDITSNLLEIDYECSLFRVHGFIGKPVITRGNRNYENYFINGRYIKSNVISKAIEEAYKPYIMQHQYPFSILYFDFPGELLDVNVHPTKMELRINESQKIFVALCNAISEILSGKEMIQTVPVTNEKTVEKRFIPEEIAESSVKPLLTNRQLNDIRKSVSLDSPYQVQYPKQREKSAVVKEVSVVSKPLTKDVIEVKTFDHTNQFNPKVEELKEEKRKVSVPVLSAYKKKDESEPPEFVPQAIIVEEKEVEITPVIHNFETNDAKEESSISETNNTKVAKSREYDNISLSDLDPVFLSEEAKVNHKIIGQVFQTYWLVEMGDKLFIIDQHAAHEKVLYERMMKRLHEKEFTSQQLNPPIIITLDAMEEEALDKYRSSIERFGYEVEHFGGREYVISAIPDNLYKMDMKDLFIEMLDDFSNETGKSTPELILEKVASMSCKAAVKGNNKLSLAEVKELIDELLTLDNPYNCPHGRPTIISMTQYELEKKFKRIV